MPVVRDNDTRIYFPRVLPTADSELKYINYRIVKRIKLEEKKLYNFSISLLISFAIQNSDCLSISVNKTIVNTYLYD